MTLCKQKGPQISGLRHISQNLYVETFFDSISLIVEWKITGGSSIKYGFNFVVLFIR
jgi:hypothetical protein